MRPRPGFRVTLVVTVFELSLAVPTRALPPDCVGNGDADANQIVDLGDHAALVACLGGPGGRPSSNQCDPKAALRLDTDGDGDIDLRNYSLFTSVFLREYFDYGPHREDPEAERLAMQVSPELRAPDDVYDRVRRDLAVMRTAYPDLEWATDTPDYDGDSLLVRLRSSADHDMFDSLNAFVLATIEREFHIVPGLRLLRFCDILNAPVLAEVYEQLDEVQYAEPNWLLGFPEDCWSQITVISLGRGYRYTFDYPSVPNQCGCWRTRILDVDEAGSVSQVSCFDSCLEACP